MDDGDRDAFAGTFADDGEMDRRVELVQGREALAGLVDRFGGRSIHTTLDPIIELDGDGARHRCTVVVYNRPQEGEPREVRMVARYEDELVRTADGWRIALRRIVAVDPAA